MTVQGSGFFQKQTTAGGITNEVTNFGGVMAGYRSTGSRAKATTPNKIVITAITLAKIGRSMKNREIIPKHLRG